MTHLPGLRADPLGRPYLPALAQAREGGEGPVRVRVTRPPFPCLGAGSLRVIAVRRGPEGEEWVLAYPDYRRLPRSAER